MASSTCEYWTGIHRDGEPVPCGKPTVAVAEDVASTTTMALCEEHLRAIYGDMAGFFLAD